MPKANSTVQPVNKQVTHKGESAPSPKSTKGKSETLEVDPDAHRMPDICNIVGEKGTAPPLGARNKKVVAERENSPGFVDDPDVPPLI